MKLFNIKDAKAKRKILRRNPTDAESMIWLKLRNKEFKGYKFYRQYGIGYYVADFYCPKLKLVLEIDGASHHSENGLACDKVRADYFLSCGVKTMRFTNIDVLKNIQGVMEALWELTGPDTVFKPTAPNTIFKPTPPSPLFELKRGERANSRSPRKAGENMFTPSLLKRGLGGVGQSKFGSTFAPETVR